MTGHPNQQTLALLAGGDLDSVTAAELLSHVDGCAECRGTLDQLGRVQGLLRDAFA